MARELDLEELERQDAERHKRLVKEAMRELLLEPDKNGKPIGEAAIQTAVEAWLDRQYRKVGKWTIHGLVATALGLFAIWFFQHGGKL